MVYISNWLLRLSGGNVIMLGKSLDEYLPTRIWYHDLMNLSLVNIYI